MSSINICEVLSCIIRIIGVNMID